MSTDYREALLVLGRQAQQAQRRLAVLPAQIRNRFVKAVAQALRNRKVLNETDPARRAAYHGELRATVADAVANRAYMMKSSMLQSLRDLVGGIGMCNAPICHFRIVSHEDAGKGGLMGNMGNNHV